VNDLKKKKDSGKRKRGKERGRILKEIAFS
jgi:hypothetical protein